MGHRGMKLFNSKKSFYGNSRERIAGACGYGEKVMTGNGQQMRRRACRSIQGINMIYPI